MKVYDVAIARRTIRRFKQKPIKLNFLKRLINAARLAPSAANLQPCEYIVINEKAKLDEVFTTLKWAGYIHPNGIPLKDKRPVAYIVVLLNLEKSKRPDVHDAAAAIENILLCAWEVGVGACWIGMVNRRRLRSLLNIPCHCKIDSVVALGYKDERPKFEKLTPSIKYWKDKKGTLHVPKRQLSELLHLNQYKRWSS